MIHFYTRLACYDCSAFASARASARLEIGKRPCNGLRCAPRREAAQNSQASGFMKLARAAAR